MMNAAHFLQIIKEREPVYQPAMVLVAHPDDEVLGLSMPLSRFTDLTLVHATDGAAGGDRDVRARELDEALATLNVNVQRRVQLDLPDGALTANLALLINRLSQMWDNHEVIVTHAYEGGHPDHDCCAVAVNTLRLSASDKPALAFPIYALGPDGVVKNRFVHEPANVVEIALTASEADKKGLALAEFVSQANVVNMFDLTCEAIGTAELFDPSIIRPASEVLFARGEQSISNAWHDAVIASLARISAGETQS